MKTIQFSEKWLEGFTKLAEAGGITPEQMPELIKLSERLQVLKTHPEAFTDGVATVTGEKQAGMFLPLLLASGIGMLGGAAGKRLFGNIRNNIAESQTLRNMNDYRSRWAQQEQLRQMYNTLPGMAQRPQTPSFGGMFAQPQGW